MEGLAVFALQCLALTLEKKKKKNLLSKEGRDLSYILKDHYDCCVRRRLKEQGQKLGDQLGDCGNHPGKR